MTFLCFLSINILRQLMIIDWDFLSHFWEVRKREEKMFIDFIIRSLKRTCKRMRATSCNELHAFFRSSMSRAF